MLLEHQLPGVGPLHILHYHLPQLVILEELRPRTLKHVTFKDAVLLFISFPACHVTVTQLIRPRPTHVFLLREGVVDGEREVLCLVGVHHVVALQLSVPDPPQGCSIVPLSQLPW